MVEVPTDAASFESVLGAAPGSYAGTAAVTRPEGPRTDSAVRVVVNPALADQPALERRLTLTHEMVHVATRSGSSPAPLWAVEGLAEYVAYRAEPRGRAEAERALAAALRRDGLPSRLPTDADLGSGATDVTVAYAEAWIACQAVVEHRSGRRSAVSTPGWTRVTRSAWRPPTPSGWTRPVCGSGGGVPWTGSGRAG